jgi:hypothetical protein
LNCYQNEGIELRKNENNAQWPGASFEGRLSDNAIMDRIINEQLPEAAELVAFLKNNKE